MTALCETGGVDTANSLSADQLEVLGALRDAQARLTEAEAVCVDALAWRAKLVARGRELGLSQTRLAAHIGVKPNVLGQAALRDRQRTSAR